MDVIDTSASKHAEMLMYLPYLWDYRFIFINTCITAAVHSFIATVLYYYIIFVVLRQSCFVLQAGLELTM